MLSLPLPNSWLQINISLASLTMKRMWVGAQHPCLPLCPIPAPDGLRRRRKSYSSPALLPTSFQHPTGPLTQDLIPGQNQVLWPTWADVLDLISPSAVWASWGVEPAPVCTSPICPVPSTSSPQGKKASCCPGQLPVTSAAPVVQGPMAAAWRSASAGLHHA